MVVDSLVVVFSCCRVFAALHLEQISSAAVAQEDLPAEARDDATTGETAGVIAESQEPEAVLGRAAEAEKFHNEQRETRMWICDTILRYVEPYAHRWGVKLINFQLASTALADIKYVRARTMRRFYSLTVFSYVWPPAICMFPGGSNSVAESC